MHGSFSDVKKKIKKEGRKIFWYSLRATTETVKHDMAVLTRRIQLVLNDVKNHEYNNLIKRYKREEYNMTVTIACR